MHGTDGRREKIKVLDIETKKQILQSIYWEVMRIMLRGGYPRRKDNEEFCRIQGLPGLVWQWTGPDPIQNFKILFLKSILTFLLFISHQSLFIII